MFKKLFKRIRDFKCDWLDWHKPQDYGMGFDGCSFTARCKFCGRKILMDSQGNWFRIEEDRSLV